MVSDDSMVTADTMFRFTVVVFVTAGVSLSVILTVKLKGPPVKVGVPVISPLHRRQGRSRWRFADQRPRSMAEHRGEAEH